MISLQYDPKTHNLLCHGSDAPLPFSDALMSECCCDYCKADCENPLKDVYYLTVSGLAGGVWSNYNAMYDLIPNVIYGSDQKNCYFTRGYAMGPDCGPMHRPTIALEWQGTEHEAKWRIEMEFESDDCEIWFETNAVQADYPTPCDYHPDSPVFSFHVSYCEDGHCGGTCGSGGDCVASQNATAVIT